MRALVLAVIGCAAAGCGIQVSGDFDGIPYTPDGTVLAVADRHDLLVRDGAVLAVKKNLAAQRVHVMLTAAWLDSARDWRAMTADDQLDLRRTLATEDGLLLRNLSLDALDDGDVLRATARHGESSGDFDLAVAQSLPREGDIDAQGLGARITATVRVESIDVEPRGGSLTASVEIKREREAGQSGDVATGAVTLHFSAPFVAERLGESNLSVASPVLVCMQERGPASAAACRAEKPWPIVDETGVVP